MSPRLARKADQTQNHTADPVILVTFNYDMLLASALKQRFGMTFRTVQDYTGHQQFKVFRLHGSVDWVRAVTQHSRTMEAGPAGIIAHVANLGLSDEIYTRKSLAGPALSYPAIAIPIKETSDFECPKSVLAQLEQMIPHVTKVLTIGWRGIKNHFLRMLGEIKQASFAVVTGTEEEAVDTMSRIRVTGISIDSEKFYTGFSDTLGDRRLDGFLSS